MLDAGTVPPGIAHNISSHLLTNLNPSLNYFIHTYQMEKTGSLFLGPFKTIFSDVVTDPRLMSEVFVFGFSSVYVCLDTASPAPHQMCNSVLENIVVRLADVLLVFST